MSQRLIDHNPDLKALRDEGFTVEVRRSFLLVHHIPYVTEDRTVEQGTLVSPLHLSGDTTLKPDDHVVHFIGKQPCHKDGRPIQQIIHQMGTVALDHDIQVDRSFSNKPPEGYRDYRHKMATYADIISAPACSLDPNNSPRRFAAITSDAEESVFAYYDTASSRAGIAAIGRKLELRKVAIFGLGGTGSYILDLIAKTPIQEIDLFDGDRFHSHNAFRAPGAASIEELEQQKFKVDYFAEQYSRMRRGIVAHAYHIGAARSDELDGIDFAFVAIDAGEDKKWLIRSLDDKSVPFIDCGIGVEEADAGLTGQVRLTTGLPGKTEHIWERGAIPFADDHADMYSRNIQIADLNALNATLAVIEWKKLMGFYLDLERELHSIYPIDGNVIINAYSAGERQQ